MGEKDNCKGRLEDTTTSDISYVLVGEILLFLSGKS